MNLLKAHTINLNVVAGIGGFDGFNGICQYNPLVAIM